MSKISQEDVKRLPEALQKLAALAALEGMLSSIGDGDKVREIFPPGAKAAMFIEPILYSLELQKQIDELHIRIKALEKVHE